MIKQKPNEKLHIHSTPYLDKLLEYLADQVQRYKRY